MDPLSLFPLARDLPDPWEIVDVAFDPEPGRIDCHLAFASGTRFAYPHYCGAGHQPVHDTLERDWHTLDHYVDQAHAQEDFSIVTAVGLDETASRRGHNYISLFHDLDAQRVLYACEGQKAQVVAQFADALEAHGTCAENIRAVCMDRSASNQAGVCEHLPGAAITFDEFHVMPVSYTHLTLPTKRIV